MALEDYDLASLRLRLQEEFAIDTSDTATKTIIDKRINDAQTWIVRRRPNWPWMKKKGVFNTIAAVTGACTVTKGSTSFTSIATITPTARSFITLEASGTTATSAHLVVSVDGSTAVVDAQYLSTTASGTVCRLVQGMFQLPDDFLRMDGPPLIMGEYPTSTELRYQDPELFQRNQYRQTPALLNNLRYTVTRDPLDLEERKYLLVFPYIADQRVIRYQYHRDCPKLVSDSDIPIVPRSDRMALWYGAAWFVAQWRGAETTQMYRDQALASIEQMATEYELVDDESGFAMSDYEPDLVLPPPGYEDFDRG